MDSRKAFVIALVMILVLWWLHPPRQLGGAPDRRDNVVEIAFMGPAGPLAGSIAEVIRQFEAQSEIEHAADPSKPIYRVISGQNAARNQVSDPTRFLVSVAGNSPPDVIEFDRYAVAEWAARGGFIPLDDYLNKDIAANRPDALRPEAFFPAAWDEAKYNGKVFGIPIEINNRALVWNGNSLRRAGIVDAEGNPKPPRVWSELRTAMRKMTRVERKSDGQVMTLEQLFASLPEGAPKQLDTTQYKIVEVGFIPMYGDSWLYMYGWANGGEFMSEDGKTVLLNSKPIVEALEFMKSLYDELGGYASVKAFETGFQGGALDPFINGQVAMKIGGVWDLLNYGRYARAVDFGVSTPPVSDAWYAAGHHEISWTGGFAYAIPSTAKNKDAAWALIRYLTSDKAIAMRIEAERSLADAEGRLYVPNQHPKKAMNEWLFNHYARDNPQMPAKYVAALKAYNDLLPVSRFRPITPVGQLLWNYHVSSTEDALYGTLPPQASLDAARAKVQGALDLINNPVSGVPIRSWNWFYSLYAVLVLLIAAAIFQWDTSRGIRGTMLRAVGIRRAHVLAEPPANSFTRPQWLGGWVSAAPWILGFLIFGGGPMLFSLVISFCRWDILNTPVFTGLDNYTTMAHDGLVWKSLGNTLYMVLSVPLGMALSLAIALLLNQGVKALPAWRTLFYLPSIVPFVATSLLFMWIFNTQAGLLTRVVQPLLDLVPFAHLQSPNWLNDMEWAKPSLILMMLWGAGGGMILWLAGLKGIPQSLYEAAAVDGATMFQQFRTVTIPQLTPYIFFNLIMGLIGTLQIFGQAFIMTQGGPANQTLFFAYHLFNNAFRYGQMGYASAMAWLLFAITLVLTVIQLRASRRWVHYDNS